MLLCKCMEEDCPNKHWDDLTDNEKDDIDPLWREDDESEEDKSWPPKSIETK